MARITWKKIISPTERKSSWRALHSRFPRIATFAARRIRLRNAPGSAYADPSAHISGIVHSCPHLGYLNYICNAYRDAVGTEYVGFAHALRLRRGVGVGVVEGSHTRTFTHRRNARPCVYSRAFSEYMQTDSHVVSRVYVNVSALLRRCSLRIRAPVLSDSSFACALGCTRICVRAREYELVTTRCAP